MIGGNPVASALTEPYERPRLSKIGGVWRKCVLREPRLDAVRLGGKRHFFVLAGRMSRHYFKRYRMELGGHKKVPLEPPPFGYDFLPWHPTLLESHAEVKWRSFHRELDSSVFACLADHAGCLRLMQEIAASPEFVPEATWLAVCYESTGPIFCGTIQGVRGRWWTGNIQNLGTIHDHRGRGVATGLLARAIHGFRRAGLRTVALEVTADNRAALELYQKLGFRLTRTLYKAVEFASVGPRDPGL